MTIDSRDGYKQGVKTYSEPIRVGPGGHETPPPPPKRTSSTPKKK